MINYLRKEEGIGTRGGCIEGGGRKGGGKREDRGIKRE